MDDLDSLVRRVDEDRWLASRFASAEVRAKLVALYAANYELAHTAEIVREPALGDIRLEWWRAGVEEIAQGNNVRSHPVLDALKASSAPLAALPSIIAARARDLDAAPFATWTELESYIDATAGALMRGALEACGARADAAFVQSAARAWGYTGLMRAAAHWRARGRSVVPNEGNASEMRARAMAAYGSARRLARGLPATAFPAIGYIALVPSYLEALARERNVTPLFARQLRLILSSATGRV